MLYFNKLHRLFIVYIVYKLKMEEVTNEILHKLRRKIEA